jgi:hypothetical protein
VLCGPGQGTWSATPLEWHFESSGAGHSSWTTRLTAWTSSSCPWCPPVPRPAVGLRLWPPYRRRAPRRRRRPPRTAPLGGSVGALVRGRSDPGFFWQALGTLPAEFRGRPPGQPRPVAHRDHPGGLTRTDPGLRSASAQRGPLHGREHPPSQALRRREIYRHLRLAAD